MKSISVDVSPKGRARLRNGHSVRVKKGEGLILLVHPDRYDLMSKTFNRGKARTIALSPEELLANMKVSPEAHQETMRQEEIQNPERFTLEQNATPLAKPKGAVIGAGLDVAPPSRLYVSNAGGTRGGYRIQSVASARDLTKHLAEIGAQVGENYGAQLKAGLGNYAQNRATSAMTDLGITIGRDNMLVADSVVGTGLYAGRSVMFGRGRREVSSVAVGGNLLGRQRVLPPALQSQPRGAFFAQNAQMPPAYKC